MKRISLLARMTSMPQPKLLNHMSYVVIMIYIHHRSHRLRISFVPIDCSANHHDCWKSIVHILVHARFSFSIPGVLLRELFTYENSHISNEKNQFVSCCCFRFHVSMSKNIYIIQTQNVFACCNAHREKESIL
jgi:hypothetical protein